MLLVLRERQAQAAAEHLVKGQVVSFTGRFEPRPYETGSDDKRLALEVHGVDTSSTRQTRASHPPAFCRSRSRRHAVTPEPVAVLLRQILPGDPRVQQVQDGVEHEPIGNWLGGQVAVAAPRTGINGSTSAHSSSSISNREGTSMTSDRHDTADGFEIKAP